MVSVTSRSDPDTFDKSLGCLISPSLDELATQLVSVVTLRAPERDVILGATRESLFEVLHSKLGRLLVLELNAARVTGRLTGEDPKERWKQFLELSSHQPFWDELASHYPSLLSRVAAILRHRCRASLRFAQHWALDRHRLSWLCGREPGELQELKFGAGDSHRVAPSRSSPVLDLEEPTSHGSATCPAGGSGSDSHYVADQSAVGCASHPRRTGECGRRRVSGHRGEVHDPPPSAAIPNLEDVPGEPRRTNHGRRLLRGTDGHVPPALRPGHRRSRASTRRAYRRHRPTDRHVDRAAAPGGIFPGAQRRPISSGIGIRRSRIGRRRRRRWTSTNW